MTHDPAAHAPDLASPFRPAALDADDPLRRFRDQVLRADPELVYLDGNSLGMLPLAAADRLRRVVNEQWGGELVRGWQHWDRLPVEVGDRIGGLVGAAPGQVVATDTISVNVFKLACAALDARPGRTVLVTDAGNFPSDRYVLDGVARLLGGELRLVSGDPMSGLTVDDLAPHLTDDVALVALSHVDYRGGAVADLAGITDAVHRAGALVLWDLAHSAGSVPVGLDDVGADFAVGCTYKYLNAGPGSPAYLYVRRDLQEHLRNPIQGWWGHEDMFDMDAPYRPAAGVARFQTGTPAIPGLVAADEGVRMLAEAGVDRLRAKSMALTSYLVELADAWLAPLGFSLASPRDAAARGGHVVLAHDDAYRIGEAMVRAKVIGDVRPPNLLRLAPAPLTTSFGEVWEGMRRIRDLVADGRHLELPRERSRVT
ncbi:MAG: kynureninase [Actinomycetota bacterium]|nr:kynureninase [Actinomycetota bacterium]